MSYDLVVFHAAKNMKPVKRFESIAKKPSRKVAEFSSHLRDEYPPDEDGRLGSYELEVEPGCCFVSFGYFSGQGFALELVELANRFGLTVYDLQTAEYHHPEPQAKISAEFRKKGEFYQVIVLNLLSMISQNVKDLVGMGHEPVSRFLRELEQKYPDLPQVWDRPSSEVPWERAMVEGEGTLYLSVNWTWAERIAKYVRTLAWKNGLAVYEPQFERICYPARLGGKIGIPESVEAKPRISWGR